MPFSSIVILHMHELEIIAMRPRAGCHHKSLKVINKRILVAFVKRSMLSVLKHAVVNIPSFFVRIILAEKTT